MTHKARLIETRDVDENGAVKIPNFFFVFVNTRLCQGDTRVVSRMVHKRYNTYEPSWIDVIRVTAKICILYRQLFKFNLLVND